MSTKTSFLPEFLQFILLCRCYQTRLSVHSAFIQTLMHWVDDWLQTEVWGTFLSFDQSTPQQPCEGAFVLRASMAPVTFAVLDSFVTNSTQYNYASGYFKCTSLKFALAVTSLRYDEVYRASKFVKTGDSTVEWPKTKDQCCGKTLLEQMFATSGHGQ
eukprot:gene9957-10977_t